MKFGDNLKRVRKKKKISQEELADRLGVSRQSVSKWETGENYPSMTNIMCLCTIFKCNINELVHEDMSDINLLDDEVKMSVVKFKSKKQRRVKRFSKAIAIIAKISWISLILMIAILVSTAFLLPSIIESAHTEIDITESHFSTIHKILVSNDGNVGIFSIDNRLFIKNGTTEVGVTDLHLVRTIENVVRDNIDNKTSLIIYFEAGLVGVMIYLSLVALMFRKLEKLFKNIYKGDTPFKLENMEYIKKIAYLMMALILVPSIVGTILEMILQQHLADFCELGLFDIFEVLLIFVISYIFEYGYEIQLDSQGKMYGDEGE